MLVFADVTTISVLGHILRFDRCLGWWPTAVAYSELLRIRQGRVLMEKNKASKKTIVSESDANVGKEESERTSFVKSVFRTLREWLGEDGLFTYPTAVLVSAFVTPILLVWLYAVSLHFFVLVAELLADAHSDLLAFHDRSVTATNEVTARLPQMCGNDTACLDDVTELLNVVGTAQSTAQFTSSWIGNVPTLLPIVTLISNSLALVLVLWLVVRNVMDFKEWSLTIWAGRKVKGFNVTNNREGHDIARSAEYIAVFASTHIIGFSTMSLTLSTIFTLLGYAKTATLIADHLTFLVTYVVMYIIVYYFLRTIVGNTWLSNGEFAKRPRRLSNFLNALSVYYITSALVAAVSRLIIALPYFFFLFCRVHYSPFDGGWQKYDYPYRASQSLLQHHTRTNNAHMITFAGALVQATEPHRAAAVAAAETQRALSDSEAIPLEDRDIRSPPRWHRPGVLQRNRWQLAYTLVSNPELTSHRSHHFHNDTTHE